MFKYLWIIMLVLIALAFLAYTAYRIWDCYTDAMIDCKANKEGYSISDVIYWTCWNLVTYNESLCFAWLLIIGSSIMFVFVFSIIAYINGQEVDENE